MSGQDGITTDSNCIISGDFNICPAAATFTFGGQQHLLSANLACPLDSVRQSDFRLASQQGLCGCDAQLRNIEDPDATGDGLNCECFICPDQANLFGVAFTCDAPITGPCTRFNCVGTCNGDMNYFGETDAPTMSPVDDSSAYAHGNPAVAAAFVVLAMIRLFH
mmetsp:Transcript_87384/g.121262  ORF Transcript_87384/g.121262 Transcript_87384/m.121262 type:complete len:164 (+) Transcript_87384:81-572(+)